jgi:methionyl-tRNA synthetase
MALTYYVTTPIYYVNDRPHIGHVYTTVAADVLARYKRLAGFDAFFLTGTDEHGQKVQEAAAERGLSPKEHCDHMSAAYVEAWRDFNILPDRFIRTTDADHEAVVTHLMSRLRESGDIYPGDYEGWYSTYEEEFVPASQVKDGHDTQGRPLTFLKEESFFFALSRYQERLWSILAKDRYRVRPETRKNEVLSFVESGLRDISISRTSISWGIPVPDDPRHVVYVWIDALINYISGIGFLQSPDLFLRYWPADVHLVGKDILRFHGVFWPALLLAAGIEPPKGLFAHGWWTRNGQKMSKTAKNFITPGELIEKYGVDAVRYFLLREIPFGHDGDFSDARMVERVNADLGNDLGNALNRCLGLIGRYAQGKVPRPGPLTAEDEVLTEVVPRLLTRIDGRYNEVQFDAALKEIWEYIGSLNKYVDVVQPWTLHRNHQEERLGTVLYNMVEALRFIALLVAPVMPESAEKIWHALGFQDSVFRHRYAECVNWGRTPVGQVTQKSEVLFPRIEDAAPAPEITGKKPPQKPKKKPPQTAGSDLIAYEDFMKVDLRSATVLEAERVPKSDKLIKLQIDLDGEKRQLVAGIGRAYTPEDLVGKQILVVANLAPAKIFGVESQGMLLACGGEDDLKLLTFDGEVSAGTRVK